MDRTEGDRQERGGKGTREEREGEGRLMMVEWEEEGRGKGQKTGRKKKTHICMYTCMCTHTQIWKA